MRSKRGKMSRNQGKICLNWVELGSLWVKGVTTAVKDQLKVMHGEQASQTALGLLYDYYHHQPNMRKLQQQAAVPQQAVQAAQSAVQKSNPMVSVKSEPVDNSFETQANRVKKEPKTDSTQFTDIKKEPTMSPNGGLPENYKGYVSVWQRCGIIVVTVW